MPISFLLSLCDGPWRRPHRLQVLPASTLDNVRRLAFQYYDSTFSASERIRMSLPVAGVRHISNTWLDFLLGSRMHVAKLAWSAGFVECSGGLVSRAKTTSQHAGDGCVVSGQERFLRVRHGEVHFHSGVDVFEVCPDDVTCSSFEANSPPLTFAQKTI